MRRADLAWMGACEAGCVEWVAAGTGRRAAAFVAGLFTFCLLGWPLLLACFEGAFGNHEVAGSAPYWLTYAVFVLCTAVEAATGASVGKRILGLRVLGATTLRLARWRAAARWLLKLLPVHALVILTGVTRGAGPGEAGAYLAQACCLYLPLLYLLRLLDPARQWPHDRWTGTGVFRRQRARRGFAVVIDGGQANHGGRVVTVRCEPASVPGCAITSSPR